jgi:hypothetical protein
MRQNGSWKGEKGDTFPSALWYLQQREREGAEMPTKVPGRKRKGKEKLEAVVELDGEKDDSVPVFDTCDEIRQKINVYMRQPSNTQSSLLKSLSFQFHTTPTTVRSSHLKALRNAGGPNIGNTNPVYYAAYVFFEKERIQLKKKKSKHRKEMEEIYGKAGGVNIRIPADKYGAWIGKQERGVWVTIDKSGLARVSPRTGGSSVQYGPQGWLVSLEQESSKYFKYFVYEQSS